MARLQTQNSELRSLYYRIVNHPVASNLVLQMLASVERPTDNQDVIDLYMRDRNVSCEVAVLRIAHDLELIPNIQYRALCLELGIDPTSESPDTRRPSWNRSAGELTFDGQIIRRIRDIGRSHRIVAILDAFERLQWERRIEDPTPRGQRSGFQLNASIRTLNQGLSLIIFSADGTTQGIRWSRVS